MKEYKLDNYKVRLKKSEYANGKSLYVGLDYYDDEFNTYLPYDHVTANIADADIPAEGNRAYVKCSDAFGGTSQYPEWLEQEGIATSEEVYAQSGFNTYVLMDFSSSVDDMKVVH